MIKTRNRLEIVPIMTFSMICLKIASNRTRVCLITVLIISTAASTITRTMRTTTAITTFLDRTSKITRS